MQINKFLRIIAVVGILLTGLFGFPQSAYATCINYIESQTIAAAYDGDTTPTVNYMDTCSGDDISYQIPIATTITFDGIEYSNVYATTNSVITFGQPDGTYWDYPRTPSISLYSMDWFPGQGGTSGLDIYYSEGGFQISLNMVPYGNYSAQPSTVNILVAITSNGGIAVSYSYQGPEYSNMRTGVRLHDGSIVTLEAWGATQIQSGEQMPSLNPDPVSQEPTLEEQQSDIVEAATLSYQIAELNSLINLINNPEESSPTPEPTPQPTPEPSPEPTVRPTPETSPEPTPQPTVEPTVLPTPEPSVAPTPEPVVDPEPEKEIVIEPEIITENDERFPDIPEKENGINKEELNSMGISKEEAEKLVELAANNAMLSKALEQFNDRSESNDTNVLPYTLADATTEVQAEEFIKSLSPENISAILSNPAAALGDALGNAKELLSNFGELGNDMTDDQREKAQEVIVPIIIASQIAGAVTRRIK